MASPAPNPGAPGPHAEPHTTPTVVMVRPARFGANAETRASNAFQSDVVATDDVAERARREFDRTVAALRGAGVEVLVLEDDPEPAKPDAVFPNNWFSTHGDGRVVLYPMHAANRRAERRLELLPRLTAAGFRCEHLVDLTAHEREQRFLEGTGSLVLDRRGRVAYACRSPRTDPGVVAEWARELGYATVVFDAADAGGRAIYHTNVVMALGDRWAAVCLEAIGATHERAAVRAAIEAGSRELLPLTLDQVHEFAGNLIELAALDGTAVIALSRRAHAALGPALEARLARHGRLLACDIPTIETLGGGSLRCMLAEVFLPRGRRSDA